MSWAQTGYDEINNNADAYQEDPEVGGPRTNAVRDFFLAPGQTRRVLILDDQPFAFWEHSLWAFGIKGQSAICLDRNGRLRDEHGRCPLCEHARKFKDTDKKVSWPSYTGYVTVIDLGELKGGGDTKRLTGWINDKGVEYNFGRKLMRLRRGSDDKPGNLQRFQRYLEKKGGSLVGRIIEVYRSGKMVESTGDEWEIQDERVDVSTVESMVEGIRALPGFVSDERSEKCMEYLTDNSPVDYMEHFTIRNRDFLSSLCGLGGSGSSGGVNYAGHSEPPAQVNQPSDEGDDIPF